jgi:hypothetical protein
MVELRTQPLAEINLRVLDKVMAPQDVDQGLNIALHNADPSTNLLVPLLLKLPTPVLAKRSKASFLNYLNKILFLSGF